MKGHGGLSWRVALALMVIVLGLSGCGRGRAEPTPEPVTLRFAFRRGIADYEALVPPFQQTHPNITVELISINPLRGGLKSIEGQDVDVLRWDQGYLTPERLDSVLPLDELILADEQFPREDLFPGALRALQYQGVQWGIPAGLDFAVAYYNAQRFEAFGVTPPTAEWTLDDFLAAALAIHNTEGSSSGADFTYGFCSEPDSADPVFFAYLFGGRLFDRLPDPSRPTLDEPANVEAVQWYTNLHLTYGVMPAPEELRKYFPRGRKFEAIVRGKCGLWLGQYSDRDGRAWGFKWQNESIMLPLPHGRGTFNPVWVDGYYILAGSKHRREAWEWIRFLLGHQEAAGQMMPPLRSQVNSPEYATRVGEHVAAIARGLPSELIFVPANPDPLLEDVIDLYIDAVERVLREETDAETALAEAQVRAEALFSSRE